MLGIRYSPGLLLDIGSCLLDAGSLTKLMKEGSGAAVCGYRGCMLHSSGKGVHCAQRLMRQHWAVETDNKEVKKFERDNCYEENGMMYKTEKWFRLQLSFLLRAGDAGHRWISPLRPSRFTLVEPMCVHTCVRLLPYQWLPNGCKIASSYQIFTLHLYYLNIKK